MAFKAIIFCASALLVQKISGQSIDNVTDICDCNIDSSNSQSDNSIISIDLDSYTTNSVSSNIGNSIRNIGNYSNNIGIDKANNRSYITSSSFKSIGRPFFITCMGPVAPSGISVDSSNKLVGELLITGKLPFLSTVGFESTFPTKGQASVAYSCGDDSIGIQKIIGGSSASKSGSCSCIKKS